MSLDIFVYGFVENNEHHKNIMKVVKACADVGIDLPDAVDKYFNNSIYEGVSPLNIPDEGGFKFVLPEHSYKRDGLKSITVDLSKIPKKTSKIQIELSV